MSNVSMSRIFTGVNVCIALGAFASGWIIGKLVHKVFGDKTRDVPKAVFWTLITLGAIHSGLNGLPTIDDLKYRIKVGSVDNIIGMKINTPTQDGIFR